jgi:hypothetical protein
MCRQRDRIPKSHTQTKDAGNRSDEEHKYEGDSHDFDFLGEGRLHGPGRCCYK